MKVKNIESLFRKEFTEVISKRRALNSFNINSLPEIDYKKIKPFYIKGITESYFSALNGTYCELSTNREKRLYDSKGEFLRGKDGKILTTTLVIPQESVIIKSTKNIKLKKRDHEPSKGYGYIDYKDIKSSNKKVERYYYYYIPKKYILELLTNVLVVNVSAHRKHYKGLKIILTNGYSVYLQVIPKSNHRVGKILCEKVSVDFKDEFSYVLNMWEKKGILFPQNIVQDVDKKKLIATLGLEDYISVRRGD